MKAFPPMHKSGNVIIENNSNIINECLFDSGAESDNFIAQAYIDTNCDILKEFISPYKSIVRSGDSKTTVNISQLITLSVTFVDNNFKTHEATLNFLIMPISHIDMIIGINSILYSLFDFFIDMLKVARNNIKKYNTPNPSPHLLDIHNNISTSKAIPDHPDYIDCVPTFDTPIDCIAPEEADIPEPVNFGKALYLLSNSRETILNDYYALLNINLSPDFVAACPQILTFMKGPIALKVFCPETWIFHGADVAQSATHL